MTSEKFNCPVCERPLQKIDPTEDGRVSLWCGYGSCVQRDRSDGRKASELANGGAVGATEEEAFIKLEAACDLPDFKDEAPVPNDDLSLKISEQFSAAEIRQMRNQ